MKAFAGVLMLLAVGVGFVVSATVLTAATAVTHELYGLGLFLCWAIGGYVVARALENFSQSK
ncbi:MAG: hypothetical protein F4029_08455 [Gammaproteobacteria bacterium]|nr:hypothetical protein [Gammaproteobacteria bacterium]MYF28605.1 hypothetical protein [Gammaproteobacteria bacterium]MYK46245.1 hypothetical protein [Gammaproteobacteria bacterium]